MYAIDMAGRRYGRLVVMERVKRPEYTTCCGAWWRCECDCGRTVEVYGSLLRRGATRSCGCLRREVSATVGARNLRKGNRKEANG